MLSYVLGTLVILLLVILFRYLPHRVFLIFVTLLLVLVGVIFYVQTAERTQEPLTMAERAAITHEQELFIPWWGDYQKQIAELDAKAGEHTLAITHARLVDLEQDMRELRARIAQTPPPTELSDRVYDPLAVIMAKTDEYAAAEQKAITLTRAAADPQTMKEKNPAEQARLLELVMLRESPVALFVGDEIGMVRHYFAPISAAQTHTNPVEAREEKSLDK